MIKSLLLLKSVSLRCINAWNDIPEEVEPTSQIGLQCSVEQQQTKKGGGGGGGGVNTTKNNKSGPSCSKLTTSLVNDSLKSQDIDITNPKSTLQNPFYYNKQAQLCLLMIVKVD